MPYQTIYKDLGVATEAVFGTSLAMTTRFHVKTFSMGLDQNKELVEDTITSSRGRDRLVRRKNVIEGDIAGYGSPRSLHEMLELVNGSEGTTTGVSLMTITYGQNVNGTMMSKSVFIDRNNSQEAFNGVWATSLEISGKDDLIEWTMSGGAKTQGVGVGSSIMDNVIGETVHPYNFSDITVTIHKGSTYGAQPVTHKVSEWSIKYDNGQEATHLSGNADVARVDPKIPMVDGKFSIFHEGSSWVSATYGASEFYIRFAGTLPSQGGLIGGLTPYLLTIDVPRSQLKTNVRNYEQNAFAVEEIEYVGMMDLSPNGTSALWKVSMTVPLDF